MRTALLSPVFVLCAACLARWPASVRGAQIVAGAGCWVEAETGPVRTGFAPRKSTAAHGGQQVRYGGKRGSFLGCDLRTTEDWAETMAFVRYSSARRARGRIRFQLVLHAGHMTRPFVGKPLANKTVQAPATSGPDVFDWVAVHLGVLPKGAHRLFLAPAKNSASFNVDVVGVAPVTAGGLWRPPNTVTDGRFVGGGTNISAAGVSAAWTDPSGLYELSGSGSAVAPELTIGIRNRQLTGAMRPQLAISVLRRGSTRVYTGRQEIYVPAGEGKTFSFKLPPLSEPDWYEVRVGALMGREVAGKCRLGLGLIRPSVRGVREGSAFGMLFRHGPDRALHQAIAEKLGVKWCRESFGALPSRVAPAPGRFWGSTQVRAVRERVDAWRAHGVSCLGFVAGNAPGNVAPGPMGERLGPRQNGPRDVRRHAEMVYHLIAPLADSIRYWELWEDPAIRGRTWRSGTAREFREMTRLVWERLKPHCPQVMLLAGGTVAFARDVVFGPSGRDAGFADGCCGRFRAPPGAALLRDAAWGLHAAQHSQRGGGRGGVWLTAVDPGLGAGPAEFGGPVCFEAARAVAPAHVLAMLGAAGSSCRVFWRGLSVHREGGMGGANLYDPGTASPRPVACAYAAMTHFLEDARVVEDLFAATRACWCVTLQKADQTSVAVLWLERGCNGVLAVPATARLEVCDYLGSPLAAGEGLALGPLQAVYLRFAQPAAALKSVLASGLRLELKEPVAVRPLSFVQPLDAAATLDVMVENLTPRSVAAAVELTAPEGWRLGARLQRAEELRPGERRVLSFPITTVRVRPDNRYTVAWRAEADGTAISGRQTVQVAYAPRIQARIDGRLDEWRAVPAVTLPMPPARMPTEDGAAGPGPTAAITAARPAARVRLGWDKRYLYLCAEVPDAQHVPKSTFADDPYAPLLEVDGLQIAFDCTAENGDDLFRGHPLYEKALAGELDYEFLLTLALDLRSGPTYYGKRARSADPRAVRPVPELHRLCAPGTRRHGFYPSNPRSTPPLGLMKAGPAGGEDGSLQIVRDERAGLTVYEAAIAWSALPELGKQLAALQPGGSAQTRFAFAVNDAGAQGTRSAFWTREAGAARFQGGFGFSDARGTGMSIEGGRILTRWGFGGE